LKLNCDEPLSSSASNFKLRRYILEATAEAESIKVRAQATAESLKRVGQEMATGGGAAAAQLRVAEQYVKEFGRIAKAGNTILLPADVGNPASMVAQAMATLGTTMGGGGAGGGGGGALMNGMKGMAGMTGGGNGGSGGLGFKGNGVATEDWAAAAAAVAGAYTLPLSSST